MEVRHHAFDSRFSLKYSIIRTLAPRQCGAIWPTQCNHTGGLELVPNPSGTADTRRTHDASLRTAQLPHEHVSFESDISVAKLICPAIVNTSARGHFVHLG
jgi:hypothetical protein